MNLEDQVTSLELSKKLRELGVKQESLFYWVYYENEEKSWDLKYKEEIEWDEDIVNKYSAFMATELFFIFNSFLEEVFNSIPISKMQLYEVLIESESKRYVSNSIATFIISYLEIMDQLYGY